MFKKFIENRFKTTIENQNSYDYVTINGKYVITWNKKMALFYYADNLNLNIVSDAIKIIDKDERKNDSDNLKLYLRKIKTSYSNPFLCII